MAIAIIASGVRNPNARRWITRSLVLVLSTIALESFRRRAFRISAHGVA